MNAPASPAPRWRVAAGIVVGVGFGIVAGLSFGAGDAWAAWCLITAGVLFALGAAVGAFR